MLGLLAVDVHAWQTTVARDDLRFRALPGAQGLVAPPTILPGDPASRLIGTGDAMAYRRALQYFWFAASAATPRYGRTRRRCAPRRRRGSRRLVGSAPSTKQRSDAANLLGVLVVTTPAPGSDKDAITQILTRAAQYFQLAISIDDGNLDAKQNLELVLRAAAARARASSAATRAAATASAAAAAPARRARGY